MAWRRGFLRSCGDGLPRGVLYNLWGWKIGKSLRQIDGLVFQRQASHLADDALINA
jgi:hypothetical protein